MLDVNGGLRAESRGWGHGSFMMVMCLVMYVLFYDVSVNAYLRALLFLLHIADEVCGFGFLY